MNNQILHIGLFGYGCVGKGVFQAINQSKLSNASIKRIVIKNRNKHRDIDKKWFTDDKWEVLNNPDINTIVEVISDAHEAFELVSEALRIGKPVVTANKKMLALYADELFQLQAQYHTPLFIEASVGGAIPIIRILQSFYSTDKVESISGIMNGTTNYILTQLSQGTSDYEAVLAEAQSLGFAEADPTSDVSGLDAVYKLDILISQAFGVRIPISQIAYAGIEHITLDDMSYANLCNLQYKLMAYAAKQEDGTVAAYVLPTCVAANHPLYSVRQEFNAITVNAAMSGVQMFKGKGAGSMPTASAILSDLHALQQKSASFQFPCPKSVETNTDIKLNFYIRFKSLKCLTELKPSVVYLQIQSDNWHYAWIEAPLGNVYVCIKSTPQLFFAAVITCPIADILKNLNDGKKQTQQLSSG